MEDSNIKKYEIELEKAIKEEDDLAIYFNHFELGKIYISLNNYEKAKEHLNIALDKSVGVNKKIEINLQFLLINLKNKNIDECKKLVEICKNYVIEGADWEKKNKLKTYEGVYCLLIRDFKNASLLLSDSIPTFDSKELISFKNLVFYASFTNFISLKRSEIKKNIIENSEAMSELINLQEIHDLLSKFLKCNYNDIFISFLKVFEIVKQDFFLKDHYNYLTKCGKVVIFKQYLEAFKTVTLSNMSSAFNLGKKFLDKELANLISSGLINCKIDKISEIIESQNFDNKNNQYQSLVKKGDNIINRLQKLSKVVEV